MCHLALYGEVVLPPSVDRSTFKAIIRILRILGPDAAAIEGHVLKLGFDGELSDSDFASIKAALETIKPESPCTVSMRLEDESVAFTLHP